MKHSPAARDAGHRLRARSSSAPSQPYSQPCPGCSGRSGASRAGRDPQRRAHTGSAQRRRGAEMSERTETPPGMRPPVRGRAEGCGWRKTKDHRGGREGRPDGGDSAAEQRAERRGRQHRGRILLPHRPAPPRVPPPPLVPPAPRDPPAAPRGPRGRSAPLRRFARMCRARPPPARPFGAGNDEGPHRGAARRECGAGDSGRSRMGRGAEGGCSPSRSPPRGQRRSPRLQRRCGVGSGLSAAPAPVLRFRPSRSADVTLQPRSVELCVSPCGCVCPRWEMALR